MSRAGRIHLRLSMVLADIAALQRHGKSFRMLATAQREQLLVALLAHPRPVFRRAARAWKQVALLTA